MKDEAEVTAARLLKEMSELHASIADDGDHPDPQEIHGMRGGFVAGFLCKEYDMPAEICSPIAARILEELSELHATIRAVKGFDKPLTVHEKRVALVADVLRASCR